jgi:hypothetical protein
MSVRPPFGARPGRVLAARVGPAPPVGIDAGIGGIVQQGRDGLIAPFSRPA